MNFSQDNLLQVLLDVYINKYEYNTKLLNSIQIIGLLHIIRKWYWQEIEAPRRVANSFKQWLSAESTRRKNKRLQKDGTEKEDSDFEDEEAEMTQANNVEEDITSVTKKAL